MVDNQHKKISGYRDLSQEEIDVINLFKGHEQALGRAWAHTVGDVEGIDLRWAAIAKTHFEEGFSAMIRSIAKPQPRF
jgi:hypothetical protein